MLGADLGEGVSGFLEAPPQGELQGELPLLGAGAENPEDGDVDGPVAARSAQHLLDFGVADHRIGDPQVAAPCFGVQVGVLPGRYRQEAEDVQPRGQGRCHRLPEDVPFADAAQLVDVSKDQRVGPGESLPQLRGDADSDRGQSERFPGIAAGQPLPGRVGDTGDLEVEVLQVPDQAVHFLVEGVQGRLANPVRTAAAGMRGMLPRSRSGRRVGNPGPAPDRTCRRAPIRYAPGKGDFLGHGVRLQDLPHFLEAGSWKGFPDQGDDAADMGGGEAGSRGHHLARLQPAEPLLVASGDALDRLPFPVVEAVTAPDLAPGHPDDAGQDRRVALESLVVLRSHQDDSGLRRLPGGLGERAAEARVGGPEAEVDDVQSLVETPAQGGDQDAPVGAQGFVEDAYAENGSLRGFPENDPGAGGAVPGLVGDLPGLFDPAPLARRQGDPAGHADPRVRRIDSAVDDCYPDPVPRQASESHLQGAGWRCHRFMRSPSGLVDLLRPPMVAAVPPSLSDAPGEESASAGAGYPDPATGWPGSARGASNSPRGNV